MTTELRSKIYLKRDVLKELTPQMEISIIFLFPVTISIFEDVVMSKKYNR